MSEKKDYQRPYFKKYRALAEEIEKLPASEQQTKVVTMFHEFYKDMRDSCELTSELSVKYIAKCAELQSALTQSQDEASRMMEAINDILDSPYALDLATIPNKGIESAPNQVVGTMSVAWVKRRALIDALNKENK
jgi:hypothetical protein